MDNQLLSNISSTAYR